MPTTKSVKLTLMTYDHLLHTSISNFSLDPVSGELLGPIWADAFGFGQRDLGGFLRTGWVCSSFFYIAGKHRLRIGDLLDKQDCILKSDHIGFTFGGWIKTQTSDIANVPRKVLKWHFFSKSEVGDTPKSWKKNKQISEQFLVNI